MDATFAHLGNDDLRSVEAAGTGCSESMELERKAGINVVTVAPSLHPLSPAANSPEHRELEGPRGEHVCPGQEHSKHVHGVHGNELHKAVVSGDVLWG